MKVRLIQVPYDSGHRERRMGRGPQHLVKAGLASHLESLPVPVATSLIEAGDEFPMENQTTFELFREEARQVAVADRDGEFAVVLSGNCDMAVGSAAGLSPGRVGIVWLDAHSDFRTPDSSYDGFLDAMGLAMLAGLCWQGAAATVPGFRPLPSSRILHIGGRLLKEEIRWLNQAGVAFVTAPEIHERTVENCLARSLDQLIGCVDRVVLHLDLDVVDPAVAVANSYARENGLTAEQVSCALDLILDRVDVGLMDVTCYDPTCDDEGRMSDLAIRFVAQVISTVESRR